MVFTRLLSSVPSVGVLGHAGVSLGQLLPAAARGARFWCKIVAPMPRYTGTICFLVGLSLITAYPILPSLAVPFIADYGLSYFDFTAMIACIALADLSWRIYPHERRIFKALLFVIATRLLSVLLAATRSPEQFLSVGRYILIAGTLLSLSAMLREERNRKLFIRGLFMGVAIESIGGIVLIFFSQRGILLGRDNVKLQVFALLFCILGVMSHAKGFLWPALGLLIAVLASGTRGALILLAVALFVAAVTFRRLKQFAIATSAVCLLAAPVIAFSPLLSERIAEASEGGGTLNLRVIMWELALGVFIDHPIAGIGSGGYARQLNDLYWGSDLELSEGYEEKLSSGEYALSTHNTVLGVAAETGTIGLVAFLYWTYTVFRFNRRVLIHRKLIRDPVAITAAIMLIVLLFSDWWGQGSFFPSFTCLLAYVMGVIRSRFSAPLSNSSSLTGIL